MHKRCRKKSKENSKKTVASGRPSKEKMEKESTNRGASGGSSDSKSNSKNHGASGESSNPKSKSKTDLNNWIPDSKMFDSVNFGFLKLGSLCNASESFPFSSAYCDVKHITNAKRKRYILNIKQLFSQGFELIEKIRNSENVLDQASSEAKEKLKMFFDNKGKSWIGVAASFVLINYLNFYLYVIEKKSNDCKEFRKNIIEKNQTGKGAFLGNQECRKQQMQSNCLVF